VRESPNGQKFKHSNKRGRGGKRRKSDPKQQQTPASTVLFETFESRVLLDAALPVAPVQNSQVANGTNSRFRYAGGNGYGRRRDNGHCLDHWEWSLAIVQETLAPALTVTGTDPKFTIAITTGGGDGRFLFSGIDVEGSAASLTGTAVDLNGGLTLNGTISRLLLGDLTVDANSALTEGSKSTDVSGAADARRDDSFYFGVNGGSTLSSGPSIIADQAGSTARRSLCPAADRCGR